MNGQQVTGDPRVIRTIADSRSEVYCAEIVNFTNEGSPIPGTSRLVLLKFAAIEPLLNEDERFAALAVADMVLQAQYRAANAAREGLRAHEDQTDAGDGGPAA